MEKWTVIKFESVQTNRLTSKKTYFSDARTWFNVATTTCINRRNKSQAKNIEQQSSS